MVRMGFNGMCCSVAKTEELIKSNMRNKNAHWKSLTRAYEEFKQDVVSNWGCTWAIGFRFNQLEEYELSENWFYLGLELAEIMEQPTSYSFFLYLADSLLQQGEDKEAIAAVRAGLELATTVEARAELTTMMKMCTEVIEDRVQERKHHIRMAKRKLMSAVHFAHLAGMSLDSEAGKDEGGKQEAEKERSEEEEARKEEEEENGEDEKELEDAACKIQAQFRGFRARSDVQVLKQQKKALQVEQDHASAVVVQRQYRGYSARKRVALMKQEQAILQEKQRESMKQRADLERIETSRREAEQDAAVKIQALARGRRDRKLVRSKREEKHQELINAWKAEIADDPVGNDTEVALASSLGGQKAPLIVEPMPVEGNEEHAIRFNGSWSTAEATAGGSFNSQAWIDCPQYKLSFSNSGMLSISIVTDRSMESFGFYLIRHKHPSPFRQIEEVDVERDLATEPVFASGQLGMCERG
eukprot:TRINITY_DN13482_c0_g1_i2.p1 TRINITY_DN13482_c0_g1~~TRINITY_DN13482_c0_g1_i2.p1  ORF type:complete len:471 (-),score=135.39 TRINITY_DN13482_c0_g1_i2:215-1627(-)